MKASARSRTRLTNVPKHPARTRVILMGAAALLAAGAALAAWSMLPRETATAGATVSTFEEIDREAIQAELNRQVQESMMTVAVSPVCTLEEGGTLSLCVMNDEENSMPQTFSLSQNGEVLFESGTIYPGEEITSCPASGMQEGDALITVQGLNPTTEKPEGSPAAVEVAITRPSAAVG